MLLGKMSHRLRMALSNFSNAYEFIALSEARDSSMEEHNSCTYYLWNI